VAQQTIARALPPTVASILEPAELESIRRRLVALPEPPAVARLDGKDWLGALGVFLLVFLSTFPVAVPFLFVANVARAMRLSNAVAIVMLLVTGILYGRQVGRSPFGFGVAMVFLGGLLVLITIELGG
jgi:VIT1/CCC1 family predicted Fe2+/Mn2+ transporter